MKKEQRFSSRDNADDLLQFTGTDEYYQNQTMPFVVYTDGVKHLFETRSAYWLGQLIATNYGYNTLLKDESFITCELIKESSEAILVFTNGNDKVLFLEQIPYTDFPDKGVCVWLIDGVMLLPSEY